jgi:Superfamily I DNA and RNA helicases and helicase subunits
VNLKLLLLKLCTGTGKTSTIVFIAKLLLAMGRRILVTSYTHAAVDNILMKLVEHKGCEDCLKRDDLIRIGSKTSVHASMHSYLAHERACEKDRQDMIRNNSCGDATRDDCKPSLANLHNVISTAKVVGVSALTIPKTPLLIGQEFDLVIIDEAGQISQPAILGALLAADKFVLVGDHEQLPPLVQNEMAEEAGKFSH